MTDVKFIMEVNSCLSERRHNESMQLKSCFNNHRALFLHRRSKRFEMARKESVEDLEERFVIRERNIGDPEVPLITRVDKE